MRISNARHLKTILRNSYTIEAKSHKEARWNSVVKEAERVVGYPTSFLSLRWILNDEIANVASHIRKLIGTNHPLLKTAKNLLLQNELPSWGLIVLLMSKVAGLNSSFTELECDRTADILHSQRILAEVTEMIKTSNMIHKGIIKVDVSSPDAQDLTFGNKLALLCGDYLLSASFNEIARLRHPEVQEMMSSTLRDLSEAEFIGPRDVNNEPYPSKPLSNQEDVEVPKQFGVEPLSIKGILGNMSSEWVLRTVLGGASLLGKGCQCSLMLANHGPHIQELGYTFGRNLAVAWQASLEIDLFHNEQFSLISAPVMFHLKYDPSLYEIIEEGMNSGKTDFSHIRKAVIGGPGLQKTEAVQKKYSELALEVLNQFSDSESKTALVNILHSM